MLTAAALSAALAAHAPVVVQDSHERFALAAVAAAPVAVPGIGRDRRPAAYGRIAPARDGGAWLQYWLFFAGQDQDRGIVRTGRHAGDWEMVQIRLDARARPVRPSTRSTPAPSAARGETVRAARHASASSTPPTARTPPTCAPACATARGPIPTTRRTAAGRRCGRGLCASTSARRAGCAGPAAGAALARAGGTPPSRTRRAARPSRSRDAGAIPTAGRTRPATAARTATSSASATGARAPSAAVVCSRSRPCWAAWSGGAAAAGNVRPRSARRVAVALRRRRRRQRA